MSRTSWGVLTLRIIDAIEQYGPMTSSDLADHLELDSGPCGTVMRRLTTPGKLTPKRLHICAWRRSQDGQRSYLRAVYGIGDLPDKRKPPAKNRRDVERDYVKRCKLQAGPAAAGLSLKETRKMAASLKRLIANSVVLTMNQGDPSGAR